MVTVFEAVDKLLGSLSLDEAGSARAAIARALALKLDEATDTSSGSAALAVAPIAKELREVVEAIVESQAADDEFVADLFASVGNGKVS